MKKKIKALVSALTAAAILACSSVPAYADKVKTVDGLLYRYSDSGVKLGKYTGWAKNAGGDRFYYKNGVKLRSCWLCVNGRKTYYIQKNGTMATGTVTVGGKSYTFGQNGRLI